jgi:hypothetical protein
LGVLRANVVEPHEIYLLTSAMLRDLEKIDDALEAGCAGEFRSDVVKPNRQN